MPTFDAEVCPRCGESMHNGSEVHLWNECKFMPCAEINCRALRRPRTPTEENDQDIHDQHHEEPPIPSYRPPGTAGDPSPGPPDKDRL